MIDNNFKIEKPVPSSVEINTNVDWSSSFSSELCVKDVGFSNLTAKGRNVVRLKSVDSLEKFIGDNIVSVDMEGNDKIDGFSAKMNQVSGSLCLNNVVGDSSYVLLCELGEQNTCHLNDESTVKPKESSGNCINNAWKKKDNIRVTDLDYGQCLSKDGSTVRLHLHNQEENAKKL